MAQSRIDIFKQMAHDQPEEVMVWYGLASEHFKVEEWKEAARALTEVLRLNPDYTAAYQMLGSAYAKLGQREEARRAWTRGIERAERTGAWKARQHMEGLLLAETAAETSDGFCTE